MSVAALFGILRYVVAVVDADDSSIALLMYVLILLNVTFVLVVGLASWGLAWRRSYGRWLSVIFVLMLAGFWMLGRADQNDIALDEYGYENPNYEMGRIFGMILMVGFSGLLLYRLIFGESVTDFFLGVETDESASDVPPPPETYIDRAMIAESERN